MEPLPFVRLLLLAAGAPLAPNNIFSVGITKRAVSLLGGADLAQKRKQEQLFLGVFLALASFFLRGSRPQPPSCPPLPA